MSTRSKWKRCWRRITGKNPDDVSDLESLREFVYLDEVSVISLLSSQLGEITAEISDAVSSSEDVQLAGSTTADIKVLKAQLDSKFQTTSSQSTQTLRKSTIQSLFRQLHLETQDHHHLQLREFSSKDAKREHSEILKDKTLCVRGNELVRGQLAEVTVQLEAAPVFKVNAMLSEMYDLSQQHPELFGDATVNPEIGAMVRVFDRLLTDLVPVIGRSEDLFAFETSGTSYIGRKSTVDALKMNATPITVVGVTDKHFYWKDLRRILFSNSNFKMLVRIDRTGIHRDWTPVKLSDIFAGVLPQMGNLSRLMDTISESLLESTPASDSAYDTTLANALWHFAAQLRGELGMTETQTQSLGHLIDDLVQRGQTDIAYQRAAFNAIASHLGVTLSPQEGVARRREARLASGLGMFGDQKAQVPSTEEERSQDNKFLLDTEIVAIYW